MSQYGYNKDGKVQTLPPFGGGDFADGKVLYDKKHNLIIAGLGGSMRYNKGAHQYSEREMFFQDAENGPEVVV